MYLVAASHSFPTACLSVKCSGRGLQNWGEAATKYI